MDEYISAAAAGLAIAAGHDSRIPADSRLVIEAWAAQLSTIHASDDEVRRAVMRYYGVPRDRVIQPGDVIAAVRDLRKEKMSIPEIQKARHEYMEALADAKASGDYRAFDKARRRYREKLVNIVGNSWKKALG